MQTFSPNLTKKTSPTKSYLSNEVQPNFNQLLRTLFKPLFMAICRLFRDNSMVFLLKILANFFVETHRKNLPRTIKKGDIENSLGDNITPPPY